MENKADSQVKGILDEAFARYKKFEAKYGVPDFEKDPRDFINEAIEELQDTIVYAAFQIARLRFVDKKLKEHGVVIQRALRDLQRSGTLPPAEEPTL